MILLVAIALIFLIYNSIPVHIEKYYCSQMLEAIEENDMEKLQSALEKGNPNSVLGIPWIEFFFVETSRNSPLQAACKAGNYEMAKLLIDSGADVKYRTWNMGFTPLCHVLNRDSPDKLKLAKLLIKNGDNVNAFRNHKRPVALLLSTPTFSADEMEILHELIAAGAEIFEEYLDDACYWKHEELIRYFVEEYGYDASDSRYLCTYCSGVEKYSYETLEYFLERGANPYIKDEKGKCAMDYLREESPEWAEKLETLAKKYGFEQ